MTAVVAAKPRAPTAKMKMAKTVSMSVNPGRPRIAVQTRNSLPKPNTRRRPSNRTSAGRKDKKKERLSALFSSSSEPLRHVQVITPELDMLHVFEVSACVAAADQPLGLVVAVAVTLTFCDGTNPTAEPSPEK